MYRYTIGVLADSSESAFHTQLLSGITDYAEENNINLLIFAGGPLQSSDINEVGRNLLYYLINYDNIDGLLVMTSTIGFHIGPEEMNKLLKFFAPIPIVSLYTKLDDYPSVVIDNKSGVKILMEHLIEDHNCKKIACIRGPRSSQDANERFEMYLETLRRYNLPVDEKYIYEGQYGATIGINAVSTFINERKINFDAIAASNDDTALGAIYTLKEHGINVPDKVKVIGFDNIIDGVNYLPRLTTVSQPIYDLGKTACKMLIKSIQCRLKKNVIKLPVECIVRESCGCTPLRIPDSIKSFSNIKRSKNLPAKMMDSIVQAIISKNTNDVFAIWKKALIYGMKLFYSSEKMYNIVAEIRMIVLNNSSIMDNSKIVHDYLFKMQEMIGNVFLNRYVTLKMKREDAEVRFRLFYETLQKNWDLQSQIKILHKGLTSLGFTECFLYIFHESEKSLNKSKLLFSIQDRKLINHSKKENYLDSDKSLSRDKLFRNNEQKTFIIVPLFYGTYQIGFMIVNFMSWEVNIYEYLRLRISSVLRNSILFEKLKTVSNNMNKIINKKTLHLSKQNKQLSNEVKKLQETLIKQQTIENIGDHCDDFRIQRVIDFIHENYSKDITLEDAANKAFMMTTYFSKIFKKKVGKGFLEYLTDVRLKKAEILLNNRQFRISEIALLVGYHDPNYFYRVFKKYYKITPGKYRENIFK